MKQLCVAAIAAVLLLVAARAAGPDDLFIRVYSLIQQADTLKTNGRLREAREKYVEAQSVLGKLEESYPKWNERIVGYRKAYLAEQLGGLQPAESPAAVSAAGPQSVPAAAPVAATKDQEALAALTREMGVLQAERDQLQAKLREALAVQPAATDPRELARAERQAEELRQENQGLREDLEREKQKAARGVEPARYEETQKALQDARQAITRQEQTIAQITRDRENLEQELKRSVEKTEAGRRKEAEAAKPQPGVELEPQMRQLEQRLVRSQQELAAEQARASVLKEEKTLLEKRLAELTVSRSPTPAAAPVTTPAVVPVPAPAPPAPVATAAPAEAKREPETRRSRAQEKAQIKQLEKERNELKKRVNALTRELEDRRLRSSPTQAGQVADELAMLRARIQVYEARQVPYSAEEMALFKQAAQVGDRSSPPGMRRAARQVPAGAAALVAEAQRAFQGRRLDEAEQKYRLALNLDERNVGLLVDLGATHLEQNRLDAAETVLSRAVGVDPNDPDVLALMGLLRFRQAKYDEALDVLGRAAQMNPENPLTQNYLGVTLSQKGLRGPAETAFRKAVQLDPNYAEAHYNLAIVYARQRPPYVELARWHYNRAQAAGQPRNPEVEKLFEAPAGGAAK